MGAVPVPSFPPVVGESGGERVARIVRSYAGCSLASRRADLGALVARGIDDPEAVVGVETNCATFALGVLAAAGCPSEVLRRPLKLGWAFAWLVELGNALGAWVTPQSGAVPPVGAALWYRIDGENVDHVEFFLGAPDEHGGAGRANNAVTVGNGDYHASWNRPLWKWLDPRLLQLPDANVEPTDPEATLKP